MTTCRRTALLLLAASMACVLLALAASALGWPLDDHGLGLLTGLGLGGVLLSVLVWFSPDPAASVTRDLMRRYRREFVPPMLAYVAVMLGWKRLLDAVDSSALRFVVALLPVVLVALVMRALVRFVRDSDELQRRIELESVAIGSLLVAGAYMAGGFLQAARLVDIPAATAMLWVFPALCIGYGVVKTFIARRYG